MNGDLSVPLIIVAGAIIGGGLALLGYALIPHEPSGVVKRPTRLLEQIRTQGRLLPLGILAGLGVLVVTRWVVTAIAVGLLVTFWSRLFGGTRREKDGVAKIEGLAAWTESLRDTVAGAVGLEQAIPATAYAAAPAIQSSLMTMADRLRVRVPLPDALERFAEDMDDASADLIIAALILNSKLRGPGLRDVLSSLARSARAELEMRQRINAGRRSTQRSVQIIITVTLAFVLGLAVFNPTYLAPYRTAVGQLVMVLIIALFGAGIMWLRRLSRFEQPERFLLFRGEVAR
ncbi:type II secretion system F family protein [Nocardioides nematodiphilus]|uniref:type II secretion system F family protein n=1 Tax=Nocardioides nematodiphilus TaxID=2849669 RepID=UPI001CDA39FD|nr:type II secretion system F family protein [Nocardioides nematodiphilus]MCA1983993.1 type II secretion system F family protein [Nocardioides nematodiphilus]